MTVERNEAEEPAARSRKSRFALPAAGGFALLVAFASWATASLIESQVSRALIDASARVEGVTSLGRDTRKSYVSALETVAVPGSRDSISLGSSLFQLEQEARMLAEREPADRQVVLLETMIDEWRAAVRGEMASTLREVIARLRPRLDEIDRAVVVLLATSEAEIARLKDRQHLGDELHTLGWAACCLAVALGIFWGVGRAREANRKLAAAGRSKSEFLANMSHEIRTPMNGVLGMADLLQHTSLSPEQREYVDAINRCGGSLLVILNDILDLSKIEAGKLPLQSIPFDLTSLVFDVVELHRPKVAGSRVDLLVDIDGEHPSRLVGDPARLRQILGNLVSNAVKFTPAGHVLVTTRLSSGAQGKMRVQVAVADTGVGISEEEQQRLFRRFSQAGASTSRRFGGTGLGLVLCRRMIEGMGGSISLASSVGSGSVFTVSVELPADQGLPPTLSSPSVLQEARVLLVDDDLNRAILERQLGRFGVRVETAASGSEALDKLRLAAPRAFDAALVDYNHLPPAGGEQLGRIIRADPSLAGLGLLVVSSSGQQGEAARMEEAGFDGYLVKPARVEVLANVLAMILERRRQGRAGPLITRHTVSEAGAAPQGEPFFGSALRVLLAEDNLVNQQIARQMLESMGVKLAVASDGFQALQAVEQSAFDLVLMDCQMPGLDGFAATVHIREKEKARGGHLPIVAMTANAMPGDREKCLAAGMDDYLTKPVTRQTLYAVIARWTGKSGGAGPSDTGAPHAGTPATTEGPSLDGRRLAEMEELFEACPGGFYGSILQSYLIAAAQQLRDLEGSLQKGDVQSLQTIAHALKGASLNLGFIGMGSYAGSIETGAKRGQLKDPQSLAAALRDEFRKVSLFAERQRKTGKAAVN